MKNLAVLLLAFGLAALSWLSTFEASAGDAASMAAPQAPRLTTVALRVHRVEEMVAFYSQAFGAELRPVDTGGIESWFGEIGGITFKLVPIRSSTDFVGYPSHQPGFEVADVQAVLAVARKYGGRQEGEILKVGDRLHASVRDPDGNTLELYGPAP